MYYIEKELSLNTGVKYSNYLVHVISHLHIDYVNREISATLCSYKSMKDLAKNFIRKESEVEICSNYFNFDYNDETFDIDPILFSLRILISTKDSPFFKAEIRRMYNESGKLNDLLLPLETDILLSKGKGEYEEYIGTSWDNNLSSEVTISDVLVGNVIENNT